MPRINTSLLKRVNKLQAIKGADVGILDMPPTMDADEWERLAIAQQKALLAWHAGEMSDEEFRKVEPLTSPVGLP